jgi:hypothetical protein
MTSRIATIFRALAPRRPARSLPDDVHFHGDDHGVFVCDNPRCDSPGLDVTRDC